MVTATKTETIIFDSIPDPSGGSDGDVLTVSSGEYVLASGAALGVPDPSGSTDGYVITVQSGAYVLAAPTGGGGAPPSGSITPVIKGATTPGTATYSVQQGEWVQLPGSNLVFFSLRVDWTAATGTGQLEIDGLPYTISGFTPVNVYQNGCPPGSGNELAAQTVNGTSSIGLYVCSQTGAASFKNVTTTGSLTISGFFFKT